MDANAYRMNKILGLVLGTALFLQAVHIIDESFKPAKAAKKKSAPARKKTPARAKKKKAPARRTARKRTAKKKARRR